MATHTHTRARAPGGSKERRRGEGVKRCVRLLGRSAVKTRRENVAGGNDEEAVGSHVPVDAGAVPPNE